MGKNATERTVFEKGSSKWFRLPAPNKQSWDKIWRQNHVCSACMRFFRSDAPQQKYLMSKRARWMIFIQSSKCLRKVFRTYPEKISHMQKTFFKHFFYPGLKDEQFLTRWLERNRRYSETRWIGRFSYKVSSFSLLLLSPSIFIFLEKIVPKITIPIANTLKIFSQWMNRCA